MPSIPSLPELTLTRPLVVAPMAGGPSTAQLAIAVAATGGFPFLAGGYLSAEALKAQVDAYTGATDAPAGVNLFVPDPAAQEIDEDVYLKYRHQIISKLKLDPQLLPEAPIYSDDAFSDKLNVALSSSIPVISFTFGYPTTQVIDRVHQARRWVALNATSCAGIDAAVRHGADLLIVQGPDAGGHRASVPDADHFEASPSTGELLAYAARHHRVPVIAAGGIAGPHDVAELLAEGATAVQVGTLFLDAVEAGTKQTHRLGLRNLIDRDTVITRAFTGRPARAIRNQFTDALSDQAPGLYPQLHYLTSGLRKQADQQRNPEHLNLWAGTGFRNIQHLPAAEIVEHLLSASTLADHPQRLAGLRSSG
ncbi:NAD(P)H-dependent flavin oxidoreductase [Auritidibacter ignavus]|uniref:NAD(P)H-dependent flavin oxidoreductase n=1 Tax=Auritidibacter ignavus TaxID=678932 RepID=UPI00109D156F|nr:nitronate monooxygenase [Auritidibacter ignavus]